MDSDLSAFWTVVLITALLWELYWKGRALWRSAHNNQKGWFITLLVINSVGILPILYLLNHPKPGTANNT